MCVFAVVCVPRSGSSMTAGILHHLGVAMGPDLLAADRWNQRGYFEDRAFLGIHRLMGHDAGDPERSALGIPGNAPVGPDLAARYRRLVRARARAAGDMPWGVKDPRLAACLPRFAAEVAGPVRLVATERPKAAVVASLKLMFGLGQLKAARIHDEYRRHRDRAVEGHAGPVLVVDYDRAIADPRGAVEAVAAFAGRGVTPEALSWIDPGLRRHAV